MKACKCREIYRETNCHLQMHEDNPVVIPKESGDQVYLYLLGLKLVSS